MPEYPLRPQLSRDLSWSNKGEILASNVQAHNGLYLVLSVEIDSAEEARKLDLIRGDRDMDIITLDRRIRCHPKNSPKNNNKYHRLLSVSVTLLCCHSKRTWVMGRELAR